MRLFRWLAGTIAAGYDLRRLGWRLLDAPARAGVLLQPRSAQPVPLLIPHDALRRYWRRFDLVDPALCDWVLVLGVADPDERARLLRRGFGDAMADDPDPLGMIHEVEARALRLIARANAVPRWRRIGAVQLDLLARDAIVAGRVVGLHPREFALLWRLADQPGCAVPPAALLGDVWRLTFRPETNSLAVHISRLRTKLRLVGIVGLIETQADGGYRLVCPGDDASEDEEQGAAAKQFALDAYVRLGKEHHEDRMPPGGARQEEDSDHGTER
ncbi:MAG: hypothetical protein RLZZ427_1734 [Pseudomonadota bacterium]|jgi:DNA-binding winged helix-turn-helix (wHTH) protein